VQQILGHHSILTTARYTHLTSHTAEACSERLNALMNAYRIGWPSATKVQPGAQP
jgi:integrase/recombinase XerD